MSSHSDNFTATIPWTCIPEALVILRSQDYSRKNTGELLMHAGWFIGCSGKLIGGTGPDENPEPDDEPDHDWLFNSSMPNEMQSSEDLETALENCCNYKASPGVAAIDWKKIWTIASPILLELLKRWLEKAAIAK